jgi:hypothetical protein
MGGAFTAHAAPAESGRAETARPSDTGVYRTGSKGEAMKRVNNSWQSEFPNEQGVHMPIVFERGQVTVASLKDAFAGGHSVMYLEYINGLGSAVTRKIDLIYNDAGNPQIRDHAPEIDTVSSTRAAHYNYKGYPMTLSQQLMLFAEVRRFTAKAQNGHYLYRVAGGAIGRIITPPGKRGVNCADFIIKVLNDAGIARIRSSIFNTPARVAGH